MKIVGFYVKKAKANKPAKVKEIQIDVDKVACKIALTLIFYNGLSTVAYAGSINEGLQPIINILKDLAEPVAYGFMVKGFMKIMAGDESEGMKTIKYAIGGFIGIQWIPFIFNTIKSIKF
jgi:hypothetical protein